MIALEGDLAATLARVRNERAKLEATARWARLEAARVHEERLFAGADRLIRRLLESVEQVSRPRTPPHCETILTREVRPIVGTPDALRADRRDAA